MKRTKIITLLTLLLLLIPTSIAFADETVEEGDVIPHDITLFGEDLHIEAGATVNGDILIYDGDVELDGKVNGDIVFAGEGSIKMGSSGSLNGDCVSFGELTVSESSQLICQVVPVGKLLENIASAIPEVGFDFDSLGAEIENALQAEFGNDNFEFNPEFDIEPPAVPEIDVQIPNFDQHYNSYDHGPGFFGQLLGTVGQSIVFGLLAGLMVAVFPQNVERMSTAARQKPVAMGVVGLLTSIAVPSVMVILSILTAILIFVCIGLLGIPILLAMGLGLTVGLFVGWVIAGSMVGEWMAQRFNMKGRSSAFTAGMGTAALAFGLGLLGLIPFVPEGLAVFAISMVGLGSAALTQFGRHTYPRVDEPQVDEGKIDIVLETLPDDLK